MQTDLSPYFESDFARSRADFLKFGRARGIENHYVFTLPGHTDRDGNALTTNVLWDGPPDAKNIMLVVCGTHGIEGEAGAAIIKKTIAEGTAAPAPPDTATVYVHALNAFGFAHRSRVNEHNVDINRNFIDWTKPPPAEHPMTARVQSLLLPAVWNAFTWVKMQLQTLPIILKNAPWLGKNPKQAFLQGQKQGLQEPLQRGTYAHPDGIFYGGAAAEWSNKTFHAIIDMCTAKAERLVFIDIHTGLGPRGRLEMILPDPIDSPAGKRAVRWWGDAVKSTVTGDSESVHVSGDICGAFNNAARGGCEITTICAEFGTQGKMDVLRAMLMDNFVRARDGTPAVTDALQEDARRRMTEAFAPKDPAWQKDVLDRGVEILRQAQAGLALHRP